MDITTTENEISLIKLHKYSCIINQNINIVWNFVKDIDKTYEILKDLRSEAEFSKGSTSYDVGSEFRIKWNNYRYIFFRVTEVIDEDNYKKQVQHIITEPTDMEYSFVYYFYKITTDDSTCLKWEIIYEGGKGVHMKQSQMEILRDEREVMIKRFENYFNNMYKPQCKQFESLIYDCRVKDLWKILTNWMIFKKLVPEICEDVHTEPNKDTFTVIWNREKSKISTMRVLKSEYNENDNIYEYNLFCFNNPPEIPDQELHFKIIKVNNYMCLLEYRHVFLTSVDSESLAKVSVNKKNILNKLRNSIANLITKKREQNENCKTEDKDDNNENKNFSNNI